MMANDFEKGVRGFAYACLFGALIWLVGLLGIGMEWW